MSQQQRLCLIAWVFIEFTIRVQGAPALQARRNLR